MTKHEWMTKLLSEINNDTELGPEKGATKRGWLEHVIGENLTESDVNAWWDESNPRASRNVRACIDALTEIFRRTVDFQIWEYSASPHNMARVVLGDLFDNEIYLARKVGVENGRQVRWFGCQYVNFPSFYPRNFDDSQCGEAVRYVEVFDSYQEALEWFDSFDANVCIVPFTAVEKRMRGFFAMRVAERKSYC